MSNIIPPMLSSSPPPIEDAFDTSWGDDGDDFGDFSSAPTNNDTGGTGIAQNQVCQDSHTVTSNGVQIMTASTKKEVPPVIGNADFVRPDPVTLDNSNNWDAYSDICNGNANVSITENDQKHSDNPNTDANILSKDDTQSDKAIKSDTSVDICPSIQSKTDTLESISQDSVTDSGLFSDNSNVTKSDGSTSDQPNGDSEEFADFHSNKDRSLPLPKSDTGESLATLSPDKEPIRVASAIYDTATVSEDKAEQHIYVVQDSDRQGSKDDLSKEGIGENRNNIVSNETVESNEVPQTNHVTASQSREEGSCREEEPSAIDIENTLSDTVECKKEKSTDCDSA